MANVQPPFIKALGKPDTTSVKSSLKDAPRLLFTPVLTTGPKKDQEVSPRSLGLTHRLFCFSR